MVIPAVALSTILGALNGYVLTKWTFRGATVIFGLMLFGCFIPFQMVLIPMARMLGLMGLAGTVPGLVFVTERHLRWLNTMQALHAGIGIIDHRLGPLPPLLADIRGSGLQPLHDQTVKQRAIDSPAIFIGTEKIAQHGAAGLFIGLEPDQPDTPVKGPDAA